MKKWNFDFKSELKLQKLVIIIALKSAVRVGLFSFLFFLYNFLTAPRTVSNTYCQVTIAQSCENHVQHTERLSRAICCVPRGTKGQLSY